MEKYHIELTNAEEALVEALVLRVSHPNHDEANGRSRRSVRSPMTATTH